MTIYSYYIYALKTTYGGRILKIVADVASKIHATQSALSKARMLTFFKLTTDLINSENNLDTILAEADSDYLNGYDKFIASLSKNNSIFDLGTLGYCSSLNDLNSVITTLHSYLPDLDVSEDDFVKAIVDKRLFDLVTPETRTILFSYDCNDIIAELSNCKTLEELKGLLKAYPTKPGQLYVAENKLSIAQCLIAFNIDIIQSIFSKLYPKLVENAAFDIITGFEANRVSDLLNQACQKIKFLNDNNSLDQVSYVKNGTLTTKRLLMLSNTIKSRIK